MAGELRCKAIRYKTALPLIRGGGAQPQPGRCAPNGVRGTTCVNQSSLISRHIP